jgi:hypothetical protein
MSSCPEMSLWAINREKGIKKDPRNGFLQLGLYEYMKISAILCNFKKGKFTHVTCSYTRVWPKTFNQKNSPKIRFLTKPFYM